MLKKPRFAKDLQTMRILLQEIVIFKKLIFIQESFKS